MSEEKPDGPGEAKGLTESVLQVIGVAELLLGAVALYALHVVRPLAATDLQLSSTGFPVLDIALLVCAAALVGKVVYVLASAPAALIHLKDDTENRLEGVLASAGLGRTSSLNLDLYDRAEALLRTRSPGGAAKFAKERDSANIFCGVSFVVALVTALSAASSEPRISVYHRHWCVMAAVAAILGSVGMLLQHMALRDLAIEVHALPDKPAPTKES